MRKIAIAVLSVLFVATSTFAGEYQKTSLGDVADMYAHYQRARHPAPGQSPTLIDIQEAARLEGFVSALVAVQVQQAHVLIPPGTTVDEIVTALGKQLFPLDDLGSRNYDGRDICASVLAFTYPYEHPPVAKVFERLKIVSLDPNQPGGVKEVTK